MTRLKTEDIHHITSSLKTYNQSLVSKTGHTLTEIAVHASGAGEKEVYRNLIKVAVIPLTCGLGVIQGFAQSVQSIVSFLGFDAFVTEAPDAGGFAEAVEKGARVIMMADDNRFVAVNIATGKISDNGEATGRGYVAGLDLMASGLQHKKVLIIGAGPVGRGAAYAAARFGAAVSVFDIDPGRCNELVQDLQLLFKTDAAAEDQLEPALLRHRIIIDACPAPAYIEKRHLTADTFIAAPGIPLGVSGEGLQEISPRLLHDPLEIGVATMVFDVATT